MSLRDLACGRCEHSHDPHQPQGVCTACGGPLLARYDIGAETVPLTTVLGRVPGQVRCPETYPTNAGGTTPTLGEGATPLVPGGRLADALRIPRLLVKDEAQNPTGSFKSRGMAAAMARAAELGLATVCLPSAGNAGGAAAAYGALHGIRVVIYLPDSTPAAIDRECQDLGADVVRVPGTIADAGHALAAARTDDWFSLATLREPYRVEGKKVMGYELLYDLGSLPDVILYPTGGGTGLVGMWKAFDEMQALGWIGDERPRMVCVQTAGCAPMVRAFEQELDTAPAWENAEPTTAFGLRVPGALGDFLILRALRASNGTAIAIGEPAMADDTSAIATQLGLHSSPEGGACVAAARQLRESGWIGETDVVVIFNTGHALKYL
ncbi:MAG: threonine synthase [Planctomycetes bacterium]|nr:threonine synthase [Planctomycetota bacterium]